MREGLEKIGTWQRSVPSMKCAHLLSAYNFYPSLWPVLPWATASLVSFGLQGAYVSGPLSPGDDYSPRFYIQRFHNQSLYPGLAWGPLFEPSQGQNANGSFCSVQNWGGNPSTSLSPISLSRAPSSWSIWGDMKGFSRMFLGDKLFADSWSLHLQGFV